MKHKFICRIACCAAAFLATAGVLAFGGSLARAAGDIEINETNFPDKIFRNIILSETYGEDGVLTEEEISDVKWISINNDGISSLQGIEYFTSLETLICEGAKLTSLDLSKNTKLNHLDCSYNNLTSLDLSKNTELTKLLCCRNNLTSLDLSKNTALVVLECYGNQLTSLDLSKNTKLTAVYCGDYDGYHLNSGYQGKISYLDVSGCPDLEILDCDRNLIKELDLSNNPKLKNLRCDLCSIEELDLSGNTSILTIDCDYNSLKKLNVKGCTSLCEINCSNNKLTSLDLSDLGYELFSISAEYNQISKVDLRNDNGIRLLNMSHNKLKEIDLCDCSKYSKIYLSYNQLSSVDFSNCSSLEELDVGNNKLTSLDVNKTAITTLMCNDNMLKTLSINNPQIIDLYCENNKLTNITVKNHKDLSVLCCGNNQLTKINIFDSLDYISCYGNKIKEIDISGNKTLKRAVAKGKFEVKTNTNGSNYYSYCYHWDYHDNDQGDDVDVYEVVEVDPGVKIKNGDKGLMTMDKNHAEVVCGKTLQLGAAFKESANETTWTSSDKSIATVDKNGKVKAKMAGTVTITAECKGKKSGCKVTVLYKDVTSKKDFWFKPTNELTAMNVVKGYDKQTKFKPANECTRAQMLTFIWRLKGEPAPKAKTCKFPDVKKSDYFFKPVIWAVENNITTGYDDGTFKPQNVCTRAQTVTFLWRLAGTPEPISTNCSFSDVKEKDYFFKPVIWAYEKKIVAGYKDGTFKPKGKCLRRQMVTFLYKYYNATSEYKAPVSYKHRI